MAPSLLVIPYADIRGGSPELGRQMTVGLSTTVIFGDLGGYFFGNVRVRPAILHGEMLPLVGQQLTVK